MLRHLFAPLCMLLPLKKKHTTLASSVWIKNNHCLLRLSAISQLLSTYPVQRVMPGGHQNDQVRVPGLTSKWESG